MPNITGATVPCSDAVADGLCGSDPSDATTAGGGAHVAAEGSDAEHQRNPRVRVAARTTQHLHKLARLHARDADMTGRDLPLRVSDQIPSL